MKALLFIVALIAHLAATGLAIRGSFDRLATKHAGLEPNLGYESAMATVAQILKWPVVSITEVMLQLPAEIRLFAYVVNSALWAGLIVWIVGVIARRKKNA